MRKSVARTDRSCYFSAMAKGETTREAILERALSMATRTGIEGLTMGTLAKEANLSKSGLFAHFQSKEQLQLDVLETATTRFIEMVIAPALREPRGEPRVRALFERWMEWEKAPFLPGGCPFIALANELDDRPGPVRERLVAYQRDWLQALAPPGGRARAARGRPAAPPAPRGPRGWPPGRARSAGGWAPPSATGCRRSPPRDASRWPRGTSGPASTAISPPTTSPGSFSVPRILAARRRTR